MLKRRFGALLLMGLFALMVIGSIHAPSSVNAVSYSYGPFEPVKNFELADIDEYRFVDAYSDVDWAETGVDPYLDTQNEPTSYISTKTNGGQTGWSSFADTSGTGTDFTVVFSIYHNSVSDSVIEWELDWTSDGTAEASGTFSTGHAYAWEDDAVDLSALDTQAEIDQCRVRFTHNKGGGGPDWVYIDAARLHIVQVGGGTAYEEYYYETITAADVQTNTADFVRDLTESVSAVDVITTAADMVRNLVESIGVVGALTMLRGREKDLVETITASDVLTNAGSFVRDFTESVSVVDAIAKAVGINMSESISAVDIGTYAKAIQKSMIETITASDIRTTAAGYARNLTESISAIDAQSNAAAYVRDFVEAITAAETVEASKAIAKNMTETIGVVDSWSRSVGYSRNFTETIAAVDVRTFTIVYVRNLVESINVVDIIDAVKGGGNDYQKDLTEGITVSFELETEGGETVLINGSLFYQLFFSLEMWGYLGPIGLVIGGYFIANKDKVLGFFWFLVESLVLANYFTLIPETPAYWWHTFILIIGCISTLMFTRGK